MFDIGWPELLIVAIVLVVVVGPKDLPRMLRTFGKTTNKLRSMAGDFRRQFDDALKEAELEDVQSIVGDARKLDPTAEIKRQFDPMKQAGERIRSGLDAALKPAPKVDTSAEADKVATGTETKKARPAVKAGPKAVSEKKTTPSAAARKSTAGKKTAARKPRGRPAAKKPTGATN